MYYYITVLIAVILIWAITNHLQWRRRILRHVEKIQGPRAYPFIGTLYLFFGVKRSDLFKVVKKIAERYEPIFRTWVRSSPEVHLMKPEHIQKVLRSSTLITKGKVYEFLRPWLGDGLLTSTGEKWHRRRKIITPAFHFKILEHFMEVFVERSKLLVDVLTEKNHAEVFDIYRYITHCTLDIICETAMGVSVNAMDDEENEYVYSLYKLSEMIAKRRVNLCHQSNLYFLLPEGRRFIKHLNVLHGFTNKVIFDRKNILKKNPFSNNTTSPKKRLSFLDLLLSSEETIPDNDIREEVDTFMFEGHDTTTAGICWSIFLLANHPDIQERVHEELKTVLGDKICPETISDLNELKYLECCIKEALRIHPSVPTISRRLTEDVIIDDYKIPKSVYVNILIHKVHRDPQTYPDPFKFDPDRFLPENCKSRHPYAYIPFSAGPRNCIGQKFAMYEEKTVLAAIFRSYKITAIDSPSTINELAELIMRPEQGVKIQLEKRIA